MKNKITSVYLIGPTGEGKNNLIEFGNITKDSYREYTKNIANILNEYTSKVGIIPDNSVPYDITYQISNISNKKTKLVAFYPKDDTEMVKKYSDFFDENVIVNGGWAEMNTQPSKNFDMMVCCGFSAGVFTEISHTKVHRIWSHIDIPILIDLRTISGPVNAELKKDTNIRYFCNDEELKELLKRG